MDFTDFTDFFVRITDYTDSDNNSVIQTRKVITMQQWQRKEIDAEMAFHLSDAPAVQGDSRLAGCSDAGKVRRRNEDAFYCDPASGLAIVADGLGGHAAGEKASALAVQVIRERLTGERIGGILGGDACAVQVEFTACLREANASLIACGTSRRKWSGMGCTVVLTLLDGRGHVHLGNLGDSRAYLIRQGAARLITRDHSVVAEFIAAGRLTPEEAESHPLRHQLTACLGMTIYTPPYYCCLPLEMDDRLILCTDGLWDMLPLPTIVEYAGVSSNMADVAQSLLRAANDAGGHDNITVVAIAP